MNNKLTHKSSKFYRERMNLFVVILWGVISTFILYMSNFVPIFQAVVFGNGVVQGDDSLADYLLLLFVSIVFLAGCVSAVFCLQQFILYWINCITLNWQRGIITYQGLEIGRINQIDHIQLRTIHQPKGRHYLSSILMRDGNQIWLEESNDPQTITATVQEIANLANVTVKPIA